MKESKTGGRLIRLLSAHGYVIVGKNQTAVLWLSKLCRDRISANDFLSWKGAINTDLVDLNEKLIEYGYEPLKYRVDSRVAEKIGKDILDNFGKKVQVNGL